MASAKSTGSAPTVKKATPAAKKAAPVKAAAEKKAAPVKAAAAKKAADKQAAKETELHGRILRPESQLPSPQGFANTAALDWLPTRGTTPATQLSHPYEHEHWFEH